MGSRRAVVSAAIAVGIGMACGDPPAGPDRTDRIEVMGPARLAPGGTAQFQVVVFSSTGGERPVEGVVRWSSSNPSVLAITAAGIATAGERGEVILSADVESLGVRRSREVLVLPNGGYRVIGTVMDGSRTPLPQTRVEVLYSPASDEPPYLSTVTGPDGRFALYGVSYGSWIRITRDGFLSAMEQINLTSHITREFQLETRGNQLNLQGSYVFTIQAAETCGTQPGALRADLRARSHPATITQTGTRLFVLIAPGHCIGDFYGGGCVFTGVAGSTGATFALTDGGGSFYSFPDFVEPLPDKQALLMLGTATTQGSAELLSGPLNGSMTHYARSFPRPADPIASCPTGRITFVPR